MEIVLKVILGLFLSLDFFVFGFIYRDFSRIKKQPEYQDSSLWDKFLVSMVFYVSSVSFLALATFLIYILLMPLTIG